MFGIDRANRISTNSGCRLRSNLELTDLKLFTAERDHWPIELAAHTQAASAPASVRRALGRMSEIGHSSNGASRQRRTQWGPR